MSIVLLTKSVFCVAVEIATTTTIDETNIFVFLNFFHLLWCVKQQNLFCSVHDAAIDFECKLIVLQKRIAFGVNIV